LNLLRSLVREPPSRVFIGAFMASGYAAVYSVMVFSTARNSSFTSKFHVERLARPVKERVTKLERRAMNKKINR
jgi:hypothetical protein